MDEPMKRREFVRSLGRNGLLLGLAYLGAAALKGTKAPSECFNSNRCAACRVAKACVLPEKKDRR